jgi:hypothetical protein
VVFPCSRGVAVYPDGSATAAAWRETIDAQRVLYSYDVIRPLKIAYFLFLVGIPI